MKFCVPPFFIAFIIILPLLLSSCFTKELPIPKVERPDPAIQSIALGTEYQDQLYFNLNSGSVVSTNSKYEWDLAFSADAQASILLNSAKAVLVAPSPLDFYQIQDTSGFQSAFLFDSSSGSTQHRAIKPTDTNTAFIVKMGVDRLGRPISWYKLKLLKVSSSNFTILYSDLAKTGAQPQTMTISRPSLYNFTYVSLLNNASFLFAPPAAQYDLLFTAYQTFFEQEKMLYSVTGVLLNPLNTRAAQIHDKPFEQVSLQDTIANPFSTRWDAIGYDWKSFDINANTYRIAPNITYIISCSDHKFFKISFLSFNDPNMGRGTIQFISQQI